MIDLDLRTIARALGGEVSGRQVLCPGPGHGRHDRSLSVRLSTTAPGGFVVKSFADDPFDLCRDFVIARLGLPADYWRTKRRGAPKSVTAFADREAVGPDDDSERRIARAAALWAEAGDAHGSVVKRYLVSRGLDLPVGAGALRYHPRCPWRDTTQGETVFVPAMIAAMRSIDGDMVTAVHRTRLSPEGAKVDRRILGVAANAAIKLDADADVTAGLAIGEGIETVLTARQLGFKPAWALASAGAVARFPVLPGIEALTILAENDPASDRATEACASRWHAAGREVTIVMPTKGSDLNDAIRGAA